jgi:outer membrane protein assembly factor BamB
MYTGTGYTARFDAISEASGRLLWSWTPPASEFSFYRNVVVTKNLAFVSTDKNVYAIDLKTHQAVRQAPYPGDLAIGAGLVLRISVGGKASAGQVVGFKLQ